MDTNQEIQEHYADETFMARIEAALDAAGAGDGEIMWSDISRLDQFHVRGLAASKELAEALELTSGDHVLDLGSGLGGPARFLAGSYGCRVTGIDLSGPFVDTARMLTLRTGLSETVDFVQGDATDLRFGDEEFDHVWTQHVAMNIPDKKALYQEAFRVLKPGGKFAVYDIMKGEGGEVVFPVPWADDPSISFLEPPAVVRGLIEDAGFAVDTVNDTSALALPWFEAMWAAAPVEGVRGLSLGNVIGGEVRDKLKNVERNLLEGRVCLVQMVASKAG